MIAAAGLQVGFGEPLDPEMLDELRDFGFTIIRLDLQQSNQIDTPIRAQEVIDAGLQPLVTIRRAEQMSILPLGSLIELGNEPDLDHENFPIDEYCRVAAECVPIAMLMGLRLYLGAISNLNFRGFNFLRQLPWADYPPQICCSIHRYPEGNDPHEPHRGWKSRGDEVRTLRAIVGDRPLACTEVGYHDGPGGSTEEEVAMKMVWERHFWSQQGFEICSAYNINDGPSEEPIDHYGFRRYKTGAWKPVATEFPKPLTPNQSP